MTKKLILLALIIAAPRPQSVLADEARKLENLYSISGNCSTLRGLGRDLSSECANRLTNAIYTDGLTSFTFVTAKGIAVTFGGPGDIQVSQGPNGSVQRIDHVLMSDQSKSVDKSPAPFPAIGYCEFENPFDRKAQFYCIAKVDGGLFEGRFLSDGKNPKAEKLPN